MRKICIKTVIAIQLIILLSLVSFTATAEQPPEPPLIVKGDVEINDEPAPEGTQITAKLDGELIAKSTIEKEGEYELHFLKMDDYTGITFNVAGIEYNPDSDTITNLNDADPTKAVYVNLSVEQPPVTVKGNVEINGNPAPAGTNILAKLNNSLIGNSTVKTQGDYEIQLLNKDNYEGIIFNVSDITTQLNTKSLEKLNNASPGSTININLSVISGEPSAERNLPEEVIIDEEFNATVNVTGVRNSSITETVPDDFKYVGSTIPESNVILNGNKITFKLEKSTRFKYTLKAPMTVEPYTKDNCKFNGTLNDGDTKQCQICGDTELDVVHPDGIVLYPGARNMVSVPYALNNSSVDHVFSDVNYTAVSYWNASAEMWEPASELEPLRAYQVVVSDDCEGVQVISESRLKPSDKLAPPASMAVEAGNTYAVGYTGTQDRRTIADTLNPSIKNKYETVTGPYINGTPLYDTVNYDYKMSKCYGYWVTIKEDGTLHGFGYSTN
ncbi:hypothetical protein Metev_1567 [Methanohalobium evestigatum Z-7303]|uniref:Uncharacterized protein n=1 Tax=Methanohalobium evestigatum (strain ATCC BAA-1072 / DSM 3721 / NBRC 107634 / OCM 161 / Z-7303) TaxID=644295 RepID=D7E9Z2_METEZ|nr:hypothetical protein [Methanohalobium evestigatum]ADI74414.1 hypothetical protein Metev_1567 [Methanohalobium evestigatum Z-7303]